MKTEMKADQEKNKIFIEQKARFELEIKSLEATLATLRAE
jgi:hypothetical protein